MSITKQIGTANKNGNPSFSFKKLVKGIAKKNVSMSRIHSTGSFILFMPDNPRFSQLQPTGQPVKAIK